MNRVEISTVDRSIRAWDGARIKALGIGDLDYFDFVATWPLEYYKQRAEAMGLQGYTRVLDIGCGHGHWTAALAALNGTVVATDLHPGRIEVARTLCKDNGLKNVDFVVSNGDSLPFSTGGFDLVFCYGVLMFLDEERTVREFWRLLPPGGRIYVCQNGQGWWAKLVVDNLRRDRALAKTALNSYWNGRDGASPTSVNLDQIEQVFVPEKWKIERRGHEGELAGPDILPAYRRRSYRGKDFVIEYIGERI